ncbi:MAG TPA: ABC transporter ATP-binding protein, partial [Sphaerochaeta sp.]|nr:ABC transporter ATP-binding protein [Sphaerochaeta sp.]
MRTNSGLDCKLLASYEEFQLDAAFNVADGELACIIGPSGCGKSTSLLLIAGLLPLEEGAIHLRGKDLSDTPTHKRNIAMVFQEYALFPHLSVGENIAYPLRRRKVGRREREKRIAELLDLVSLSGYQRRRIDELSGGEQQRVALARALGSEPDLLLLDEPLSALDAKLRISLRDEIKRIHAETGITTVYVTHDQEEALSIADKIIVMDTGTVVQSGTPESVYNEPETPFVATFIGEGNTISARHLVPEATTKAQLFF